MKSTDRVSRKSPFIIYETSSLAPDYESLTDALAANVGVLARAIRAGRASRQKRMALTQNQPITPEVHSGEIEANSA